MSAPAEFSILPAARGDVEEIAALAAARRADDDRVVSLVARDEHRLRGYVFATLVAPPPVYAPGGPSGFVDDFAVRDSSEWPSVGRALLAAARERLAELGAAQVVVVCGHHDEPKLAALLGSGLTRASEWLVAPVERR